MENKNKLSVGFIGLGRWGKRLVFECDKLMVVRVAHACSDEKIIWLKEMLPHIMPVSDINAIFNNEEIEAVIIATPIDTHTELVKLVFAAGKHVFVEKPLSSSHKEASELIALARQDEKVLFVGQTYFYSESYQHIRRQLNEEIPQYIRFVWNKYGTFDNDITWNLIVHDTIIACDLLGEVLGIEIEKSQSVESALDQIVFTVKHEKGEARFEYDRVSKKKEKYFEIETNKRTYVINDKEAKNVSDNSLIVSSTNTPVSAELSEFLERVRNNQYSHADLDLYVRAVALVELLNSTIQ
ncbi:MAG: Gfo/Idh/MocA family oxidoreductase [Candidatus Heimdallarchaeota archaeon]|nr:Gfo/Idh/MocA family oxidoreductase [Candidatus Heimdallarchaeota archaeon]